MGEKIRTLYEESCSKVEKKKSLDAANSAVITTDMWTSRATEAYLTVSCHIIDENLQMKAYVLETGSFLQKKNPTVPTTFAQNYRESLMNGT